ncbi:DUF1672 family protein [Bacillus sp. CLL-7-23]|uniref:DUF1672 family protein n=1 Tax=Bacillus changyiensis TaxID=3004103 RepID=A0ABT4X219_9BACI|nr:DUF1672 family protein [Bacillus changyiensis]MDA7026230.1 DUF1672 family protein [Bacillus changyiensis]
MKNQKIILLSMSALLLLAGCQAMKKPEKQLDQKELESVQKFGDEMLKEKKVDEKYHDKIKKAVRKFFLDKYKTKVKINQIVRKVNSVTVFVESEGEPHFYTEASLIMLDEDNILAEVNAEKDDVEDAIRTGIYAMACDKEFKTLDNYLKKATSKYHVKALKQKDRRNGYRTPYYNISIASDAFGVDLNKMYLKNPKRSKMEWRKILTKHQINDKKIKIDIQLYLETKKLKDDHPTLKKIIRDLKKMDDIAPGIYEVHVEQKLIGKSANSKK